MSDAQQRNACCVVGWMAAMMLLGFGMGGCVERCGPWDSTGVPNSFISWQAEAQTTYLADLRARREAYESLPKSDLSAPVVFIPAILMGVGLAIAVFVVAVNWE